MIQIFIELPLDSQTVKSAIGPNSQKTILRKSIYPPVRMKMGMQERPEVLKSIRVI